MNDKLRELLALELANEDMGIYPQAVHGGNNPYEKRTERMEGWNDYGMTLSNKWISYSNLINSYSDNVVNMLLDETLTLMNGTLSVNCSDLFYWGTADWEDITLEEMPDLEACLALSPDHGGLLWASRKRGMRPQQPYYKHFTPDEVELFNAAGPERRREDEG